MSPCPCCGQAVESVDLHVLAVERQLSPFQRRIVEAVWQGRGAAVPSERIYNAMYADDADGGPGQSKMVAALKEAVYRIREKLRGTGVDLVYDGFRRGYSIRVNHQAPRGRETVLNTGRENLSLAARRPRPDTASGRQA